MKTFVIKRNSWHYRCIDKMFSEPHYRDFCTYLRKLILAVAAAGFLVAVFMFGAGFFGWAISDFLAWLVAGLLYGFTMFDGPGLMVPVAAAILIPTFGIKLIDDLVLERRRKARLKWLNQPYGNYVEEPGIVKLAYMKFKSKTCMKVRYE